MKYQTFKSNWNKHSHFFLIKAAFIREVKTEMTLPIMTRVLAPILSLLIFKMENLMGIWQRSMFIITFGWMIHEFRK